MFTTDTLYYHHLLTAFPKLMVWKKNKHDTHSINKMLEECVTEGWNLKRNLPGYVKRDLNEMREWAMETLQREDQAEGPVTVKVLGQKETICLMHKAQWSFLRSPAEAAPFVTLKGRPVFTMMERKLAHGFMEHSILRKHSRGCVKRSVERKIT